MGGASEGETEEAEVVGFVKADFLGVRGARSAGVGVTPSLARPANQSLPLMGRGKKELCDRT